MPDIVGRGFLRVSCFAAATLPSASCDIATIAWTFGDASCLCSVAAFSTFACWPGLREREQAIDEARGARRALVRVRIGVVARQRR